MDTLWLKQLRGILPDREWARAGLDWDNLTLSKGRVEKKFSRDLSAPHGNFYSLVSCGRTISIGQESFRKMWGTIVGKALFSINRPPPAHDYKLVAGIWREQMDKALELNARTDNVAAAGGLWWAWKNHQAELFDMGGKSLHYTLGGLHVAIGGKLRAWEGDTPLDEDRVLPALRQNKMFLAGCKKGDDWMRLKDVAPGKVSGDGFEIHVPRGLNGLTVTGDGTCPVLDFHAKNDQPLGSRHLSRLFTIAPPSLKKFLEATAKEHPAMDPRNYSLPSLLERMRKSVQGEKLEPGARCNYEFSGNHLAWKISWKGAWQGIAAKMIPSMDGLELRVQGRGGWESLGSCAAPEWLPKCDHNPGLLSGSPAALEDLCLPDSSVFQSSTEPKNEI